MYRFCVLALVLSICYAEKLSEHLFLPLLSLLLALTISFFRLFFSHFLFVFFLHFSGIDFEFSNNYEEYTLSVKKSVFFFCIQRSLLPCVLLRLFFWHFIHLLFVLHKLFLPFPLLRLLLRVLSVVEIASALYSISYLSNCGVSICFTPSLHFLSI